MRDTQKSKVYKAEHEFRSVPRTTTLSKMPLKSTNDAQRYVNKVLGYQWFIKRYGRRNILVQKGRGGGRAYGWRITLGVWARQESVILHEIAHCIAPMTSKHDAHYAGAMLWLVDHVYGKQAGQDLRKIYKANKVKYSFKKVPKVRVKIS